MSTSPKNKTGLGGKPAIEPTKPRTYTHPLKELTMRRAIHLKYNLQHLGKEGALDDQSKPPTARLC
jgi:hypothetical protein